MERTPRRGLEVVLGSVLAAALVAGVLLIYESFSGTFSSDLRLKAQISQAGDALEQGDIVTYNDVIVGEVTGATGRLGGGAALTLKIHRGDAAVIPADVTAIAVPESLFGSTKIVLVPGRDTSGPKISAQTVIGPDTSPAAESLQTALSTAYELLTSIHPAQLDEALSSLATALEGQGDNLGQLITRADQYLRTLAPTLPQLDDVITSFATVTDELAKNSPALLSSLGHLLTVSQGVQAEQQAVANLLSVAPTAVDNARLLFSPKNVDNTVTVVTNEQSVLGALAADPGALPATINGFKNFADAFSRMLSAGPYGKINVILTGANLTALLNVGAGQNGEVFTAVSDPPEYTAAQCPRYGPMAGPNCATANSVDVIASGTKYGGAASSIGSSDEVATVRSAASALTGLNLDQIPDAVDLLLGPLLRGHQTVIR